MRKTLLRYLLKWYMQEYPRPKWNGVVYSPAGNREREYKKYKLEDARWINELLNL